MEIKDLKVSSVTETDKIEIKKESKTFKDKVPAHWTLVESENGVFATNTVSRETFEGDIFEFN